MTKKIVSWIKYVTNTKWIFTTNEYGYLITRLLMERVEVLWYSTHGYLLLAHKFFF